MTKTVEQVITETSSLEQSSLLDEIMLLNLFQIYCQQIIKKNQLINY